MFDINRFSTLAMKYFDYQVGAFYGSATGMSLGTGLIYEDVRIPVYDESNSKFRTADAIAYVLTHECDVDDANARIFSDYLLVCPIIKFEEWAEEYALEVDETSLGQFIPEMSSDKVNRVFFLPPFPPKLQFGGLLYLNQICSTHRERFRSGTSAPICAVSEYAQQRIDFKLRNHLFRTKAEQLPRLR